MDCVTKYMILHIKFKLSCNFLQFYTIWQNFILKKWKTGGCAFHLVDIFHLVELFQQHQKINWAFLKDNFIYLTRSEGHNELSKKIN